MELSFPTNLPYSRAEIGRAWNQRFDLVHMRHLLGAMSKQEWTALYKRIYDNLLPGGWIEQVEGDIGIFCDDGSLPKGLPDCDKFPPTLPRLRSPC